LFSGHESIVSSDDPYDYFFERVELYPKKTDSDSRRAKMVMKLVKGLSLGLVCRLNYSKHKN